MNRDPARRLQSLREHRVFRERTAPVGPLAAALGADLLRLEKKIGGVAGAWAATCPMELVARTTVEGLSRGVLNIRADDSGTRYELDRWLRSGGERELVKRCPTTVRKVRINIAESEHQPRQSPRTR